MPKGQGYHEAPDPITGKARQHQINALKSKGKDISNVEIVPAKGLYHFFKDKFRNKKSEWETIDRVPHWAWKKLDLRSLVDGYRIVKGKYYIYRGDKDRDHGIHLYRKRRTGVETKNIKVVITPKWKRIFDEEIRNREIIHGTPLSTIQKIKAARNVSHQIFPTNKGPRGHLLRQVFRKEILKTINVDYEIS